MTQTKNIAIAAFIVAGACFVLNAQEDRLGKQRGLGSLALTSSYTGHADVDSTGSFSETSTHMRLRIAFFSLSYTQDHYDWEDTASLPFGDGSDPWEDLHSLSLGARWGKKLSDTWLFHCTGGLGVNYERQIDDAWGWFGIGVFARQLNEDWRFNFGIGYAGHQKVNQSFSVFPIVGINYRRSMDEGWSWGLGFPNTSIQYRFNLVWAVSAGFAWRGGNVYRLADNNRVVPAGYAEVKGSSWGITVRYYPSRKLRFRLGISALTGRGIEFYDRDGDELQDYDVESRPVIWASATVRF